MKTEEVDVKNGAVFLTDAHYKKGQGGFLKLLNSFIENPPPQIFFLGDIFHLLLPFKFLYEYNKDAIELINKISEKTEVYYIYGNHDFCMEKFFPKVVFADAFTDTKKSIYIAHGDLESDNPFYKIYSFFVRNRVTLGFLNTVTFNFYNNFLFKKLLNKKINCTYRISDLKTKRDFKHIIFGHYHNFARINNILILSSFFCNKKYYIIHIDKKINFKEMDYGGG